MMVVDRMWAAARGICGSKGLFSGACVVQYRLLVVVGLIHGGDYFDV